MSLRIKHLVSCNIMLVLYEINHWYEKLIFEFLKYEKNDRSMEWGLEVQKVQ